MLSPLEVLEAVLFAMGRASSAVVHCGAHNAASICRYRRLDTSEDVASWSEQVVNTARHRYLRALGRYGWRLFPRRMLIPMSLRG